MTYRFLLFSQEVENFVMEIIAPASSSFLDIHNLILENCSYVLTGNHRFFLCNEDWKTQAKVYLSDDVHLSYDEDLYLMEDAILEDFIEEDYARIAYVYNVDEKKTLLLELVDKKFGETIEKAVVGRKKGVAPAQFDIEEDEVNDLQLDSSRQMPTDEDSDFDDSDDSFSEDELDMEGFELSE